MEREESDVEPVTVASVFRADREHSKLQHETAADERVPIFAPERHRPPRDDETQCSTSHRAARLREPISEKVSPIV